MRSQHINIWTSHNEDVVTARIDGMICRAEEAGFEKGREEGIKSNKIKTARIMFDKGFSVEDIVEITGLSEKSILNSL